MNILGLSGYYHDSAAALVRDGEIIAAAQEERFSRVKHDANFPTAAVRYCLQEGGVGPNDLDAVAWYEKPVTKFGRLMNTYLEAAPRGRRSFVGAMPTWMRRKLWVAYELERELRGLGYRIPRRQVYFSEHHLSHAASAFYPSPFESAAVVTMDGVGEWATSSIGRGRGNHVQILQEQRFPHSVGLLYSAFTYFCGFRVNSGEYKLMGLAPFGEPRYLDLIRDQLVDLRPDGSIALDLSYFDYLVGSTMTNAKFAELFGGPPRRPESDITQREMDLARSIQELTEDIMLGAARHAHALTGERHLCLAGGVALNCVGNGRLLREGPFDDLWVQPAAGDAGGSLGSALWVWHQVLGNDRVPSSEDAMQGSSLGPRYGSQDLVPFLDSKGAVYTSWPDEEARAKEIARHLAGGAVVALFQGRMEFGPRALGNRSIIGDPRSPKMQSIMNLKIKFRESFRPFAPAILEERAGEYFDLDRASPYMLLVADVSDHQRVPIPDSPPDLVGRVNQIRSTIPAVTHVDMSARVQTVTERRNRFFWQVLRAFEDMTGCPVLINTSFNVRGEPIVCTPDDAYRCFMRTGIDHLLLEEFLLDKTEQPTSSEPLPALDMETLD